MKGMRLEERMHDSWGYVASAKRSRTVKVKIEITCLNANIKLKILFCLKFIQN